MTRTPFFTHVCDAPRTPESGVPILLGLMAERAAHEGRPLRFLVYAPGRLAGAATTAFLDGLGPEVETAATPADLRAALARRWLAGEGLHAHDLWSRSLRAVAWTADDPARARASLHGALMPAAMAVDGWKKEAAWRVYGKAMVARFGAIDATSPQEAAAIAARLPQACVRVTPPPPLAIAPRPMPPGPGGEVLFFGRLHPIKGVDRVLDAWAAVAAELPDWRLRLCGPADGRQAAAYRRRAAGSPRTLISGPVAPARRLEALAAARIVIAPSRQENFGLTIAEALALGRPVLTTPDAGWPAQDGRVIVAAPGDLGPALARLARALDQCAG